jgi:hypothetical protein
MIEPKKSCNCSSINDTIFAKTSSTGRTRRQHPQHANLRFEQHARLHHLGGLANLPADADDRPAPVRDWIFADLIPSHIALRQGRAIRRVIERLSGCQNLLVFTPEPGGKLRSKKRSVMLAEHRAGRRADREFRLPVCDHITALTILEEDLIGKLIKCSGQERVAFRRVLKTGKRTEHPCPLILSEICTIGHELLELQVCYRCRQQHPPLLFFVSWAVEMKPPHRDQIFQMRTRTINPIP